MRFLHLIIYLDYLEFNIIASQIQLLASKVYNLKSNKSINL